jgi:hypothetical protein
METRLPDFPDFPPGQTRLIFAGKRGGKPSVRLPRCASSFWPT